MTVTRYRTPSVVEVVDRPAVRLRLSPPTRAEITVPPGRHRVEAERTAASPVVGRPGPVKDCHRYDDQTIEEAGITADVAQDGTMTLSASDHSACLEIPVAGIQSAMPYRVSFEHRTLSGERARYCVFDRVTGTCVRQGRFDESGRTWQRAEIEIDAPDAVGTDALSLYLYADAIDSRTVTQYRSVAVTPLVDEFVALVRADTSVAQPPQVTWRQLSPARYRVQVRAARGPFVLALSDSWSADWRVSDAPADAEIEHLRIDGYRNGWAIDARGDLDLLVEYVPARAGQRAIRISAAAAVTIAVVAVVGWARRRMRRRVADVARRADDRAPVDDAVTRPRP